MNADPIRTVSAAQAATLEARFGLRVAARLNQSTAAMPHDLSERLRVARAQALSHVKPLPSRRNGTGGISAVSVSPTESWWWRLTSFAPLAVLMAGLFLVHETQFSEEITAAADVDAALLTDAIPLAAYSDPGFSEFLKEPSVVSNN